MARMHSRKKGKAGSKKPLTKAKPTWLRYEAKEVELLVAKVSKEGKTPSQIGIALRDSYGVPDVKKITEKSLTVIMKEKGLLPQIPEDLMALIKKSVTIKKHMGENKHDMTAKRGLELTDSKIRRLVKYYQGEKVLPKGWSYDPEKVKLLIS
ncbi:30S ribosomal protein S15 [Candidatus Woesearchaeota archaeon]|nr:30S ribosomal protein S15 [Candidatus Woesearchaeota archaeon]